MKFFGVNSRLARLYVATFLVLDFYSEPIIILIYSHGAQVEDILWFNIKVQAPLQSEYKTSRKFRICREPGNSKHYEVANRFRWSAIRRRPAETKDTLFWRVWHLCSEPKFSNAYIACITILASHRWAVCGIMNGCRHELGQLFRQMLYILQTGKVTHNA